MNTGLFRVVKLVLNLSLFNTFYVSLSIERELYVFSLFSVSYLAGFSPDATFIAETGRDLKKDACKRSTSC